MFYIVVLAANLLQGSATSALVDPRRAPPSAIRDSLEAAELRFFHEWRDAYRLSEDARHRRPRSGAPLAVRAASLLREAYTLCNGKLTASGWNGAPFIHHVSGVRPLGAGLFSACPTWALADSLQWNEARSIDAALGSAFFDPVRRARASIIAQFDAGVRALPNNDWIAGQRVRLLLDQEDHARAVAAARACTATRSWCRLLGGLSETRNVHDAAGDSLFRLAIQDMTPTERCRWTDARELLDSAGADVYARMTCAQRDSANRVLWWLADPMWTEVGNERWTEHMSRAVWVRLRSDLERDERYSWNVRTGGDALTQMVVRYGWPTATYWSGQLVDYFRSAYLTMHSATPSSPYTTFEYSGGRLHTVPGGRTLADPFHSEPSDWQLADSHHDGRVPIRPDDSELNRAVNRLHAGISAWWPQEHFAPRAPIVDLAPGQFATLRRADGLMIANAIDLDSVTLQRRAGTPIIAALVTTSAPDMIATISRARVSVGTPLVLFGATSASPALVGVEFSADSPNGPPGGRLRFGVTPPAALSAIALGDVAISDLVLLRPPASGAGFPRVTDSILPYMATSNRIAQGARLGVYWETYSIAPSDSVEIAVWIERYTPQGIFRRFGNAINIATDLNTPVSSSWTETAVASRAYIIPGRIPIIAHAITVDASRLATGEYWLSVVVRQHGHDAIQTRRSITVEKR